MKVKEVEIEFVFCVLIVVQGFKSERVKTGLDKPDRVAGMRVSPAGQQAHFPCHGLSRENAGLSKNCVYMANCLSSR